MTKRELNRALNKWISILCLHDWDITVIYIPFGKVWGELHYDIPAKNAKLNIVRLNAKEWKSALRDPESILVHELLHIVLIQFKIFETLKTDDIEEDVVNYLTKLLITMERKNG